MNDYDEENEAAANDDPATHAESPLPGSLTWLGLALVAAIFLPLAPDGRRFLDLLYEAFEGGILDGLVFLAGFGSPFLFGLMVAIASRTASPKLGARLVRPTISLMHSQLVIAAYYIWRHSDAIAALPFFGFSIVSAIYFALNVASAKASSAGGPSLRWFVRWGAMLIMAVAAYCRLQTFAGHVFGWATSIALMSAALMLRMTNRKALP